MYRSTYPWPYAATRSVVWCKNHAYLTAKDWRDKNCKIVHENGCTIVPITVWLASMLSTGVHTIRGRRRRIGKLVWQLFRSIMSIVVIPFALSSASSSMSSSFSVPSNVRFFVTCFCYDIQEVEVRHIRKSRHSYKDTYIGTVDIVSSIGMHTRWTTKARGSNRCWSLIHWRRQ